MITASARSPVTDKQVTEALKEGADFESKLFAGGQEINLPGDEQQEAGPIIPARRAVTAPVVSVPGGRFSAMSDGGIEGDFDDSDIRYPQLKIVQGSGPLSAQWNPGTLLYSDEQLFPPPNPAPNSVNPVLRIIPVHIKKQYREKLTKEQQDAGEMPRIVGTKDEVEELGGTTRWISKEQPATWAKTARCLFLLEQPEGSEHPGFATELSGKLYAPAIYYAGGSAYSVSAQLIFNASLVSLLTTIPGPDGQPLRDEKNRILKKVFMPKCVWTFQVRKAQVGDFWVFQPVLRLLAKEETNEEVREYCRQLMGAAQPQTVEED